MRIGCQVYVKGSVDAVAFYQRAFDWTIGMNFKNPDGTYAHASLMSGEREVLAVAEDGNPATRTVSLDGKWPAMAFNCAGLNSREAVDRAYDVLSEGARTTSNPGGPASVPWNEYCFTLVDKFGVYWWVAI